MAPNIITATMITRPSQRSRSIPIAICSGAISSLRRRKGTSSGLVAGSARRWPSRIARPRPHSNATIGAAPSALRKCGAYSLSTVGISMIAPLSRMTPKAGRRQRQSATPKPIKNGMLIKTSSTGNPGWLLRGSGSPCRLNIVAVANRLLRGVPPAAPAGPTASWLLRNSNWSGCWSQFNASGATTMSATIPERSRGAEERRNDGAPMGARFPISLSPCFLISLSPCLLVSPIRHASVPTPSASAMTGSSRPAGYVYGPRPAVKPNAIHAARPFVRTARQKAHNIKVKRKGTKIGSMPTRTEENVPTHDRQRKGREQRHCRRHELVGTGQLPTQGIERRHGQGADQGSNPTHDGRRLAEKPEGQAGEVDEHRLDAEVAGEEDRMITALGQHAPGFQRLISLIVVETGRNTIQMPETKKSRQGGDQE